MESIRNTRVFLENGNDVHALPEYKIHL